MIFEKGFRKYLCFTLSALILLAALNAYFDPFGSMEGRRQGRFNHSVRVPILMYHHFTDGNNPEVIISAEGFESHIKALCDAGYTSVTFEDLCDFVYIGTPLPERPVMITIDDGYMSVYETAFPILQKYNMKATVFIIGVFHGQSVYKDALYRIIPHFGDAEAQEMVASGLISIQSHSFDMHQYKPYEPDSYREGIRRIRGESRTAYIEAFTADFEAAADQIERVVGARPFVYSYPFGMSNRLSESLLKSMGVRVTLLTASGISTVVTGAPQSLYGLRRLNVFGDMTPEDLLTMIG